MRVELRVQIVGVAVTGVNPCGWTTGFVRTKPPAERVGIRIRWVDDSRAPSEAAWLSRIADAKLVRSMSRKGCSPDNAACEGFFGRLKTEWFYPGNWGQFVVSPDSASRATG